jgi:hypothetical protein
LPADTAVGATFQMAQATRMAALGGVDDTLPAYMDPIRPLMNASVARPYAVLGFGARSPIYGLPAGFTVRLGTEPSHFFFSGTYVSNGVRIGLIRIPTMAPPSTALALQQLDEEIAFFNSNTDVLIVDIMRNPGGTVSVVESFARRLFPAPFRTVGFEIRATAKWVTAIVLALSNAQAAGAPAEIIENLRAIMNEIVEAYNEDRGRTAPVPLGGTSLVLAPAANAYVKPLMLLVDEMAASGGDMLAAIIQDNHRGPLLGMRTMGAGGSVLEYFCTTFTESVCTITESLMNRGTVISGTEYPPSPYLENIGVRPDIVVDYMTRANLMSAGAPFVKAFTEAAVKFAQTTAVSHQRQSTEWSRSCVDLYSPPCF